MGRVRRGRLLPRLVLIFSLSLVAVGVGNHPIVAQAPISSALAQSEPQDSVEIARQLGIPAPEGASPTEFSLQISKQAVEGGLPLAPETPLANIPLILDGRSPFSTAVLTAVGGPQGDFAEVDILADIDGREDLVADHGAKVDDLSARIPVPNTWMITRIAASAHTIANGFAENVFYYGDSVGNLYIATGNSTGSPLVQTAGVLAINLPTALNAFGSLSSNDQIVITGIGVNPVADLSSFANVNGSFAPFNGRVGEVIYVAFWDTGGGLRLATNNMLVKSGVLAFPVADIVSPPAAPPGIQSPAGFPVMVGGSFGVAFSVFANLAGVAVDDDGSVYFQQVDLMSQFTGGNIVKITDVGSNQDRSSATSGIITLTTLNPVNGIYGTASGPVTQVNRFTNFSGTSTTFGNIASLASGPHNTLYAAVARSHQASDDVGVQATEGYFENPPELGPTPSMIISLADATGAYDPCSSYPYTYTVHPSPGVTVTLPITGILPIGDSIADIAAGSGITLTAGVNNFRIFALGAGPDIRSDLLPIGATITDTLQMDFQVDYSIFSGLTVDENHNIYLVSGGSPASVGRDPSPTLGEVLLLPDRARFDRRADAIDLRGDVPPNPPLNGGNTGDGDSDRYDHIFWTAPMDQIGATPAGLAGLSRGFLLYLNRTRNTARFAYLPSGSPQGDNQASGPIPFLDFDPQEQVAGGDDFNPPFRGDSALSGFEYTAIGGTTFTQMYLSSNGNLTFGAGDTDNIPTGAEFLAGPTRIAAAWTDVNPSSRTGGFLNTFPVQALGFSAANSFKTSWINVPAFGGEKCGARNSFSITLFDDGTGSDESAPGLVEGPTDGMFSIVDTPHKWRSEGSEWFFLDYGRMDLLGTQALPVLSGYTIGGNTDAITSTNLSEPMRGAFALGIPYPALITVPRFSRFEFFDTGTEAKMLNPGPGQEFEPAVPSYDLRFTGNNPLVTTPADQPDLNWDILAFIKGLGVFFPILKR